MQDKIEFHGVLVNGDTVSVAELIAQLPGDRVHRDVLRRQWGSLAPDLLKTLPSNPARTARTGQPDRGKGSAAQHFLRGALRHLERLGAIERTEDWVIIKDQALLQQLVAAWDDA